MGPTGFPHPHPNPNPNPRWTVVRRELIEVRMTSLTRTFPPARTLSTLVYAPRHLRSPPATSALLDLDRARTIYDGMRGGFGVRMDDGSGGSGTTQTAGMRTCLLAPTRAPQEAVAYLNTSKDLRLGCALGFRPSSDVRRSAMTEIQGRVGERGGRGGRGEGSEAREGRSDGRGR